MVRDAVCRRPFEPPLCLWYLTGRRNLSLAALDQGAGRASNAGSDASSPAAVGPRQTVHGLGRRSARVVGPHWVPRDTREVGSVGITVVGVYMEPRPRLSTSTDSEMPRCSEPASGEKCRKGDNRGGDCHSESHNSSVDYFHIRCAAEYLQRFQLSPLLRPVR